MNMPTYLGLSTYNQAGASALLEQGFAARTEQFREGIEAIGGTLDGYWFSTSGQIVVMMSFDEAPNFALPAVQGMASGTWLDFPNIQEIFDGAEMDAELAQQVRAYDPPGS